MQVGAADGDRGCSLHFLDLLHGPHRKQLAILRSVLRTFYPNGNFENLVCDAQLSYGPAGVRPHDDTATDLELRPVAPPFEDTDLKSGLLERYSCTKPAYTKADDESPAGRRSPLEHRFAIQTLLRHVFHTSTFPASLG